MPLMAFKILETRFLYRHLVVKNDFGTETRFLIYQLSIKRCLQNLISLQTAKISGINRSIHFHEGEKNLKISKLLHNLHKSERN